MQYMVSCRAHVAPKVHCMSDEFTSLQQHSGFASISQLAPAHREPMHDKHGHDVRPNRRARRSAGANADICANTCGRFQVHFDTLSALISPSVFRNMHETHRLAADQRCRPAVETCFCEHAAEGVSVSPTGAIRATD